jgi:hypothetical protein
MVLVELFRRCRKVAAIARLFDRGAAGLSYKIPIRLTPGNHA